MKYFDVIIDNNSKHTDTFFTYRGDDCFKEGDVVIVPFGKGNREKRGFIFGETSKPDCPEDKIKSIIGPDPDISLNEEIISTCRWMVLRYGIKYIDAIRCFVPKGKAAKAGKEKHPLDRHKGEEQQIEELTEEQKNAMDVISEAVIEGRQENFLIHGVTGSGKTEVYMQVIDQVQKLGKTAIMLVPEIALTKQITERFISRFGKEKLAILHSRLTGRERFDEWQRIRKGEATIVIGARLGVFAPLENIGVIIMDEEHEATYKSDQTPKFDTVDIALKRLMYYSGVLIMGSATPSVVSYQRAKEGIYRLIELSKRYHGGEMPDIELVDMRQELRQGNSSMFSGRLYTEIRNAVDSGQQVILFLNRRGYSPFISCRSCGEPLRCPECGITLTYHKREGAAICHYCGRKFKVPDTCPACGSDELKYSGIGTEQLEEFTAGTFPDCKVERLDLDTAKNSSEINRIISDFVKGKTDILIGTQLVAKGLDFKNVGLVGVVAADGSLNIPDYRSDERTFQLVTQVAGRAGRGDKKGKVIVQTYQPENTALKMAVSYDYKGFFEDESRIRELMGYPPFGDLIMVDFLSTSEAVSEKAADYCKEYLIKCGIYGDGSNILSPQLSTLYKVKDVVRYYIIIKSPKGYRNKYVHCIEAFYEGLQKKKIDCTVIIDVNPYSMV